MLLPDNINPYDSIYFNGAMVLKKIQETWKKDIIDLYQEVKKDNWISFSLYILCLDWLYITDLAILDNNKVELCL